MAQVPEAGIADAIYEPLEVGLDKVGLMRGRYAPGLRFITGSAIAGGALWLIQPSIMFTADGTPKNWSLTSPNSEKRETTALPWWLASLTVGFALGFLI